MDGHEHSHSTANLEFVRNDGQWEDPSLFQSRVSGARVFFEHNRITFLTFDRSEFDALHTRGCPGVNGYKPGIGIPEPTRKEYFSCLDEIRIRGHVYRVNFINALPEHTVTGSQPKEHWHNYYYGDDPDNWQERVPLFREVVYQDLYPEIDLVYYSEDIQLKYDFIVHPGGSVDDIKMEYEDLDDIELLNDQLYLHTSLGEVVEWKPYAYQVIDDKQVEVTVKYTLQGDRVGFEVLGRYDRSATLIIDPVVVLSTYTGSTADNWGYTATYDRFGNLYGAGFAEGSGYPVTGGAFDLTFGGGTSGSYTSGGFVYTLVPTDIVITKYNPDGSSNLYSTYLGGNRNELPHSLVVNNNDELVMLGTTSSGNFPTTAGCFDNSFNGGSQVEIIQSIRYQDGSDIVLSKFSIDGGSLLASTFLGGSGNDGLNTTGQTRLEFNYGDAVRGDLIIDAADNVYIASCSFSNDFPGTAGHYQPSAGGNLDAVIARLNSDLTSLDWATYLGGSSEDAAYSIKLDASGNLVLGGGTRSGNFPGMTGLNTSYGGGDADGFVLRLTNNGNNVTAGTFLGVGQYDQVFMIEVDESNEVYAMGQTLGSYPTANAGYVRPNAPQFIHKLSSDLNSTVFSTTFGRNNYTNDGAFGFQGSVNISPTSFLVDVCGNIYATGWGGAVNNFWNDNGGTVQSMGTSADANQPPYFRNGSSGDDFYIFVLDQDANNLVFGAYFGEPGGAGVGEDHVDGGTCRFDENGIIYHAVCASCTGSSGWPTTPGAYSSNNNSGSCNMAAYKLEFDLSPINSSFDLSADSGCAPLSVNFTNLTNKPFTGSQTIFWDFGDGNTLNDVEDPVHVYNTPGTYTVTLIVTDPLECNFSDTSTTEIIVEAGGATADFTMDVSTICVDGNVGFTNNSTNATGYAWDYGDGNTSTTGAPNHVHNYAGTGPYTVSLVAIDGSTCNYNDTTTQVINAPCCPDIQSAVISPEDCTSGNGTVVISVGNTGTPPYDYSTNGGVSYILNDVSNTETLGGLGAGTYTITVRDGGNCTVDTTITIGQNINYVTGTANAAICQGDTYTMPLGEQISQAGVFQDTIPGFYCDSIVTVTIGLNNLVNGSISVDLCGGDTYTMPQGEVVSSSGIYTDTIAGFNCDSVVTVTVTSTPYASGSVATILCPGETYTMPLGEQVNQAGVFTDTISGFTCDSIVTVTITLDALASGSSTVDLCAGESYTMPLGEVVSSAGIYTDTIAGSNCDSIVMVTVTTTPFLSGTDNADLCPGESYTMPLGEVITSAGIYVDTLTTLTCDSIVTVTITNSTYGSGSDQVELCQGQSYTMPGGATVNSSGMYTDTISGANCDSIVTIDVTVSALPTGSDNANLCPGESYTMPAGEVTTTAGVYVDTIAGWICDSVITVTITTNQLSSGTEQVDLCTGDSYTMPLGEVISTAGVYVDTIAGFTCDSVVTVTINVGSFTSGTEDVSLCPGESYVMPLGEVVNMAGTYQDTLSGAGCDSIVTVNVTISTLPTGSENVSLCPGESYTMPLGEIITTAGIYMDTLSAFNCDSVVSVTVVELPYAQEFLSMTICQGDSVSINGSDFYNTTGIFADTIPGANCDSIVTLDLTVEISPDPTSSQSICPGDSATINGIDFYYTSGAYTDTLSGVGCDSIRALNLTVLPYAMGSDDFSGCTGDQFTINGIDFYTNSGIYIDTISGFQCDSIVTLDVTIHPVEEVNITRGICTGDSITINGNEYYDVSGVYTDTLQGFYCDSIVTIDLTVSAFAINVILQTICDGDSISLNGVDYYSQTGIYNDTIAGFSCDSIVSLDLTVLDGSSYSYAESICAGDSVTIDGNQYYTASGSYMVTLSGSSSCDSLITLNLTVGNLQLEDVQTIDANCVGQDGAATVVVSGNAGDLTFTWFNDSFDFITFTDQPTLTPLVPGSYFVDIEDAAGCSILAVPFTIGQDSSTSISVMPTDTSIFYGESVVLEASPASGSFIWSPAVFLDCDTCSSTVATPEYSISYFIQNDRDGCRSTAVVYIDVREPEAIIPTAFSPNGDDQNDILYVIEEHVEELRYFEVYNRWGELLFETNNISQGWDGSYKGKQQELDTYIYHIGVLLKIGRELEVSGAVILLR